MATTTSSQLDQIHALLASKGYSVSEPGNDVLRIQEVESGVALRAVLSGDILFLSVTCMEVAGPAVTAAVMRKMLDSNNGISTSHFQLYDTGNGNLAVTLNNFCKLEDAAEIGPEDQDDILSCVSFLLVDVAHARQLIGGDLHPSR